MKPMAIGMTLENLTMKPLAIGMTLEILTIEVSHGAWTNTNGVSHVVANQLPESINKQIYLRLFLGRNNIFECMLWCDNHPCC